MRTMKSEVCYPDHLLNIFLQITCLISHLNFINHLVNKIIRGLKTDKILFGMKFIAECFAREDYRGKCLTGCYQFASKI